MTVVHLAERKAGWLRNMCDEVAKQHAEHAPRGAVMVVWRGDGTPILHVWNLADIEVLGLLEVGRRLAYDIGTDGQEQGV